MPRGRATDFPAATGTIVAPLVCTEEEAAQAGEIFGLAACQRMHSKTLTRQARCWGPTCPAVSLCLGLNGCPP
jgi:hypothetical protein